ncbi:terminase family protein [Cypionkella psychrotolerans]|uniref:terminase family protein n=1 Tax=Cypionkella psychrotolerans TaxID=1678131 RepID=UPI0006B65C65|nr:terminase family protein [Cypionkella psychrotolerans]
MTIPLSEQQWADARAAAMAAIPAEVQAAGLPAVLLPYQARTVSLLDSGCPVLFVEKSRRIGLTWALGAYAVLRAARQKSSGGMDVMYISYSREMTREFIDACGMWARAFNSAAGAVEEVLFDQDSEDKAINAFRIKFASGFEIMALSSAPRGLRGKQGCVIIDEAAFVDDLEALLKSAMAFTMWGGQVVVCSTHLGAENEFNVQIQDILGGRVNYAHLSITLDQALEQGLYRRIALVTGKIWSPEAEADWRQGVINRYRDNADEELYCVPSMSSGSWLPAPLIEARMTVKTPVLRLELPRDYMFRSRLDQAALMAQFMEELRAQLAALDLTPQFAFGFDFARVADLTAGSLMAIEQRLKRREVLAFELRNVPGVEQKLIVRTIFQHVRSRLIGAAFDATGMGWTVAEDLGREFGLREDPEGSGIVIAVKFTEEWYRLNMPPLKVAFEDDMIALIADAEHLGDIRAIKIVRGIARVPALREGTTGKKRHGDHAIAVALAHWASRMRFTEYGYVPVNRAATPANGSGWDFPANDDGRRDAYRSPLGAGLRGGL